MLRKYLCNKWRIFWLNLKVTVIKLKKTNSILCCPFFFFYFWSTYKSIAILSWSGPDPNNVWSFSEIELPDIILKICINLKLKAWYCPRSSYACVYFSLGVRGGYLFVRLHEKLLLLSVPFTITSSKQRQLFFHFYDEGVKDVSSSLIFLLLSTLYEVFVTFISSLFF